MRNEYRSSYQAEEARRKRRDRVTVLLAAFLLGLLVVGIWTLALSIGECR